MKKFFSKLPVLIAFAVVTVLFAALTIGLSVRPISHGMTYNGTMTIKESSTTIKVDASVKFKSDDEAVMKAKVAGVETEQEMWVLRNGNKVYMMEKDVITKEEFKEQIKELKADKEQWNELWKSEEIMKINAFGINGGSSEMGMTYKATAGGAIALTTILSIVTLVGVAGTTLSVIYYIADKKSAKVA